MAELARVRSVLFMPGKPAGHDREDPRLAPDVAVVDLEDAVAADDKAAGRRRRRRGRRARSGRRPSC